MVKLEHKLLWVQSAQFLNGSAKSSTKLIYLFILCFVLSIYTRLIKSYINKDDLCVTKWVRYVRDWKIYFSSCIIFWQKTGYISMKFSGFLKYLKKDFFIDLRLARNTITPSAVFYWLSLNLFSPVLFFKTTIKFFLNI